MAKVTITLEDYGEDVRIRSRQEDTDPAEITPAQVLALDLIQIIKEQLETRTLEPSDITNKEQN